MTNPASPRPPKRPKSSGTPPLIRCGSVAVKIYKLSREKGAYFTVSWHTGPKRNRQNFKAFEAAKKFARGRAEEPAAGQVNSPTVTIAQAQDMKEALRRIGPLGTPVHVVAGEYADVVNQLSGTGTLRQAVEFFLHNSIRPEMQRTVAGSNFPGGMPERPINTEGPIFSGYICTWVGKEPHFGGVAK